MKHGSYLIAPYVIGIIIATAILGPTIYAWYSNIDDHWIAKWLGSAHTLSPSKIWSELVDMGFGTMGDGKRFRPLFFCYWLLETAVLGDHPSLFTF
jgi:hypothetical protein